MRNASRDLDELFSVPWSKPCKFPAILLFLSLWLQNVYSQTSYQTFQIHCTHWAGSAELKDIWIALKSIPLLSITIFVLEVTRCNVHIFHLLLWCQTLCWSPKKGHWIKLLFCPRLWEAFYCFEQSTEKVQPRQFESTTFAIKQRLLGTRKNFLILHTNNSTLLTKIAIHLDITHDFFHLKAEVLIIGYPPVSTKKDQPNVKNWSSLCIRILQ